MGRKTCERNEGALQWLRERAQKRLWRRERENGEKRNVDPVTVIKLGPT